MSSLDNLVQWIHEKHCKFQLSDDVVKEIEDMVIHLVKVLLPNSLKHYPGCRYAIAEVLDAGSYFEKTKIHLPNEFDFMLVIEQLSSKDAISVTKGCRNGYAKVEVVNWDIWDTVSANDGPERKFEIAMLQFNMYIREVLKSLLTEPLVGRHGQLTMKAITVRGKPYKAFSHVQTLALIWKTFNLDGGMSKSILLNEEMFKSETKEMEFEICVDLMSCCHLPITSFTSILPETSLENEGLKENGCHIVLKSCESTLCMADEKECRLVSYTKTEQMCMKKLHINWKIIYKVLKWIFGYTELLEVDTYKIKTAVLYVSSSFGATDNSIKLGEGLLKILDVLRSSACENKLSGHFNSSLNIWNINPGYYYLVKYEIIFLQKIFKAIQNMPAGDEESCKYAVNVVDLWLHSFCSHAVEILQMKKNHHRTRLESFNWQGNVFLEILKNLEPVLKTQKTFTWISFQMKCYILLDLFKTLFSRR